MSEKEKTTAGRHEAELQALWRLRASTQADVDIQYLGRILDDHDLIMSAQFDRINTLERRLAAVETPPDGVVLDAANWELAKAHARETGDV